MAPLVRGLEFIRFLIRPFVLVLRPFVKLGLGLAVMHGVSSLVFGGGLLALCL